MRERYDCYRRFAINGVVFLYVVVVILTSSAISSFGDDQTVEGIIVQVRFDTNAVSAERDCEKYLSQFTNSPESRGRIYLALALNNTFRSIGDYTNILKYSKKALECPLQPIDACRAYENIGDALRMKIFDGLNLREESNVRKEALEAYLTGLRLVLGKTDTLQKQELPVVPHYQIGFVGGTNNPEYKRLQQLRETQLKTYRDVKAANDLIDEYEQLKLEVVSLYFRIPFVEEITAEAEKVAPGDPKMKALAQELTEDLDKSNASLPTHGTNKIK
jgi:hypothetical protein